MKKLFYAARILGYQVKIKIKMNFREIFLKLKDRIKKREL